MEQIFKYQLANAEKQSLSMPKGAMILTAQIDQKTNIPCIWAIVNAKNEPEIRTIHIYGTGMEFQTYKQKELFKDRELIRRQYINTIQIGPLVYHIFEIFN